MEHCKDFPIWAKQQNWYALYLNAYVDNNKKGICEFVYLTPGGRVVKGIAEEDEIRIEDITDRYH